MDPQRQYAQLLTLWSQGSKMFRRSQYRDIGYNRDWDGWWRLGRRLVDRGLTVLPVPLGEPTLVVSLDETWFTLLPGAMMGSGLARGTVIGIDLKGSVALRFTTGWSLGLDLALRLGQRGFRTLLGWRDVRPFAVADLNAALTLLGAMDRVPDLFRALATPDWPAAAYMLRHPGRRYPLQYPLPAGWGFCYDDRLKQAWWDGQDEDSVH